jgi:hypothetical protein
MSIKFYDSQGNLQDYTPADDDEVIKKDGSVPFTGDVDLGDNKLTNVKEPAAAGDAIRVPDSVAAGDIFYWNGTTLVRLAKGSAGQVLTMNGGATAPEWATP